MDGIKWLFFDIGSTLADESLAYEEIYRKIAKAANKTYDFVYEKALEYSKNKKIIVEEYIDGIDAYIGCYIHNKKLKLLYVTVTGVKNWALTGEICG